MSINLSDSLHAATSKGKLASAKEIYLDGDTENLQQVGEKIHELEETVKNIDTSGKATTVSYDNTTSGLKAVNAQAALDELAAKNKSQDTEINKKANTSDVSSQMQTEQARVNTELGKKFDKKNVAQELGDSEDKVVSQYALPFRAVENEEWVCLIVDAEEHILFGIRQNGSVDWGTGVPNSVKDEIQEIIDTQTDSMKTELSALINTFNTSLSKEIQNVKNAKVDKEEGKSLIDNEVKKHFEVIENEEWLIAIVDAEGHILLGINREGEIIGKVKDVDNLKEALSSAQSDVELLQTNLTAVDTNATNV